MKRILLALSILLCFATASSAQTIQAFHSIEPGMKFREYKHYYDYHLYTHQKGDPYSRFWTGTASFFIPGLGQMFEGEWVRGIMFLAAATSLYAGTIANTEIVYDDEGKVLSSKPKNAMASVCSIGQFAVSIWSIVDAVHVAKIKNMYYQDLRALRSSVDAKLEPFVAFAPSTSGTQPVTGLNLKITF